MLWVVSLWENMQLEVYTASSKLSEFIRCVNISGIYPNMQNFAENPKLSLQIKKISQKLVPSENVQAQKNIPEV